MSSVSSKALILKLIVVMGAQKSVDGDELQNHSMIRALHLSHRFVSFMPCQVGNEAARDALKHTLSYIIRAAMAEIVPSAGPITSIHYDKRGAKISVQYKGDDCKFSSS